MTRAIGNERGLTLIELCLTLLILGLIVAAASPRLSRSYRRLQLKTAAESIADEIRMIQRRAEISQQAWRFIIRPDGKSYAVECQHRGEFAEPPATAATGAPEWEPVIRRTLPAAINLAPVAFTIEWTADGVTPHQSLRVCDAEGNAYEIRIEESGLALHPTGEKAWR
ncbi:MAG: prepilin-type N-terminal cleavage/methylation domain-containing protein [candidate division KSB1 bacterium]|nr:prepilin-type N-terminal cleavage/methylation domain-containing protein [candidate division KSB1 bacterium]MDZ7300442.1 prepilin-type N-terminal cleavage/methylation domain-containing protein [candidate division KSB1 bacterium]MDZ7308721.1 prepilin-type N-terminal cleavage/methylation domain-containing protein [candidate division KSB1 bacterium]MDZ7351456.1 prepilin-type N-terminal cleavage/methylation domain-containing protein [candidate division KSB1 bacterium]MDZ7355815.1 prepilin-type N-